MEDIGIVTNVLLGQTIFKAELPMLYPLSATGFFDLLPVNATTGHWKNSDDGVPVIEMSLAPVVQASVLP